MVIPNNYAPHSFHHRFEFYNAHRTENGELAPHNSAIDIDMYIEKNI